MWKQVLKLFVDRFEIGEKVKILQYENLKIYQKGKAETLPNEEKYIKMQK